MKRVFVPALMIAVALQANAQSEKSSEKSSSDGGAFSVTFGASYSTTSLSGGTTTKAKWGPLIDLSYTNGGFFASGQRGIGYNFVQTKTLQLGAGLSYLPPRKESKDTRLRGLGDVKGSPAVLLSANWSPIEDFISLSAVYSAATKRTNGSTLELGTSVGFPIYGSLNGSVDLSVALADRNHVQTYYGVTAAQSAASGYSQFSPKAGVLNTSLSVNASYELSKNLSLGASVGAIRRQGDAAKSPIFTRRNEPTARLFATYNF